MLHHADSFCCIAECALIFVITKGCVYVHRIGVFRDHIHRGMLFCDHIVTIDDISVEKYSNNNALLVFYMAKTKLELFLTDNH